MITSPIKLMRFFRFPLSTLCARRKAGWEPSRQRKWDYGYDVSRMVGRE